LISLPYLHCLSLRVLSDALKRMRGTREPLQKKKQIPHTAFYAAYRRATVGFGMTA
jgi:hypothetical protein